MSVFQFCVSLDEYQQNEDHVRDRADSIQSHESEMSETAQNNPLIQSITPSFFKRGEVNESDLIDLVGRLQIAFEQGTVSDEELMYALRFEHSALTKFLLTLTLSDRAESASAVRCLAFAGNIDPMFWVEFIDDDYTQHFKYMLNALRVIPLKVSSLLDAMKSNSLKIEGRYIGFDHRDVVDYQMQGYEDIDAQERQFKEDRAEREELIMVYLLLLTQFLSHPIEMIEVSVENDRDRYRQPVETDDGVIITNAYTYGVITDPIHNQISTNGTGDVLELDQSVPSSSNFSTQWNNSIVKYNGDYLEYKYVLQHLVQVAQSVLNLTNMIFEDGYQQCLKFLLALNTQFPLLDRQSTEIVDIFIKEEVKRSDGGVLTQGMMYLLNENGFPNMSTTEATAALKFCYNLMNHMFTPIDENNDFKHDISSQGHFYSNDVKVLVDIAIRELVNIPVESSYERLRISYINLLEGIVSKTSWSTSTDYYKKETIVSVLQGIIHHDSHACKSLVEELIYNFPYLKE